MAVYLGKNKVELFGGQRVAVDGVTLPTLENPGTANDLAEGMQLIGADGNVVTGAVKTYSSQAGWSGSTPFVDGDDIRLNVNTSTPYLFRKGVFIRSPLSNFGDASPSDVAKGKYFTSTSGLKIEGEHVCSGGVTLPTLRNQGFASDLVSGKELIDQDGNIVTGTVEEIAVGTPLGFGLSNIHELVAEDGTEINFFRVSNTQSGDVLVRDGVTASMAVSKDEFGNATPDQVLEGVTFTSSEGLKLTGELVHTGNSGGFVIKTGTTTSNVITTGLNSIRYIFIYKSSISATGFVQGVYRVDTGKTNYVYCSSYSSYLKVCATTENTNGSINGGTFTWNGTDTQALTSGTTYDWIAVGT